MPDTSFLSAFQDSLLDQVSDSDIKEHAEDYRVMDQSLAQSAESLFDQWKQLMAGRADPVHVVQSILGLVFRVSTGQDSSLSQNERQDFCASVFYSISITEFISVLSAVLFRFFVRIQGLDDRAHPSTDAIPQEPERAFELLASMFKDWQCVAHFDETVEKAWALALWRLKDDLLKETFSRNSAPRARGEDVVSVLERNVESPLNAFTQIIHIKDIAVNWSWMNPSCWALGRLWAARLYEMVQEDIDFKELHNSNTVQDLMMTVARPETRTFVSGYFQYKLRANILTTATSTVRILDVFMRVIDIFKVVDPSGVLLPFVADNIQEYLRSRSDAVTIIINSLLEGSTDKFGKPRLSSEDFSARVAICMDRAEYQSYKEYYESSDFDELEWCPEPIDAVADHRAARTLDALAYIVRIQKTDVFKAELQTVLSERLLSGDDDKLEKEIRLLAMFKQRFRDLEIQQAEVMLRDITESQRLNHDVGQASSNASIDFQAKILSPYYWPALREIEMKPPQKVSYSMEKYSHEFNARKAGRRLEWLYGQGGATIELELNDRTVVEHVTPWQAAVINAFSGGSAADPASRSMQQLTQMLGLDAAHVRAALDFWVGKMVLQQAGPPDHFSVLENLPSGKSSSTAAQARAQATASVAASHAADAAPSLKSAQDVLADRKPLYSSCVVAMLTNKGAMDASRIFAFLGSVLPGGFPFEEAELVRFLETLGAEGSLERDGDVWRVRRK